jgi:hypothetical protein
MVHSSALDLGQTGTALCVTEHYRIRLYEELSNFLATISI